jgi:hypothetical protein
LVRPSSVFAVLKLMVWFHFLVDVVVRPPPPIMLLLAS